MTTPNFNVVKAGTKAQARITEIKQTTAAEVFTATKGENAGKFQGKFSKPTDKVFVVWGRVEGQSQDVKLGTYNYPKRGNIMPNSHLAVLIQRTGVDLSTLSDDLRELKGKSIEVTLDSKGFARVM
jgi:hypothetical protein